MEFIEIKPTRIRGNLNYLRNIIRASFTNPRSKENTFILSVYIGKNIANKLNLKPGDKVSISYGEEDQRLWLIKKATGSGYKLLNIKESSPALKFQLTWRLFVPKQNEMRIRKLKINKIDESGVVVNFY